MHVTKTAKPKTRQAKRQSAGEAKTAGKGKNATQRQGARSLQDDDAIEGIGARLAASLAGINPVAWARLRQADQAYQRKTMKPALTKLVKLLEDLGKLERERPFRVRGEELLEQSRQYLREAKPCHGYGRPGELLDFQPHERRLAQPEGLTFTDLARFFQHHIDDNIPSARRGSRGELVRDLEHDELERHLGVKDYFDERGDRQKGAEQILVDESRSSPDSYREVLRQARSKRAKKMIGAVQRDLEEMLKGTMNKARRRNLEDAIAEIRQCEASRKDMGNLVVKLTERGEKRKTKNGPRWSLGFGTRVAVIDLGRYVRALWP